jgi:hypothetical protein
MFWRNISNFVKGYRKNYERELCYEEVESLLKGLDENIPISCEISLPDSKNKQTVKKTLKGILELLDDQFKSDPSSPMNTFYANYTVYKLKRFNESNNGNGKKQKQELIRYIDVSLERVKITISGSQNKTLIESSYKTANFCF